MPDDLRSTLEAAVAAEETSRTEGTPMPEVVTPTPAPAEKPTFDAASGKEVVETTPPAQKPEGTDTDTPSKNGENAVEEPTEPAVKIDRAPQSWKPAQKAKWDKIDPDIRQEIVRRDREVTRGLAEAAPAKKFVQGFQEVVKPYAARFQSAGIAPQQAIKSLLHVDHTLATAPAADRAKMMANLIKDYGIDIVMLDAELSGQAATSVNPMAAVEQMLAQKLQPFQQFIAQTEEQRQALAQRDFEQQQTVVENMANDPKYPLFDMVRDDMADVIELNLKKGKTLPLDQVYNRAVAMNPEAAAEAAKLSKQSQAQKANQAAQRALGASLSVSGNASTLRTEVPSSDLRGTIEAAVLAASGR